MLRLRISDTRSHAETFYAASYDEFALGLYEALQRYTTHFKARGSKPPRPHLHIWTDQLGGRWIDAGYGRGTYIVVYADMTKNTAYCAEIWERCQSANRSVNEFSGQLGSLIEQTVEDVKHG